MRYKSKRNKKVYLSHKTRKKSNDRPKKIGEFHNSTTKLKKNSIHKEIYKHKEGQLNKTTK